MRHEGKRVMTHFLNVLQNVRGSNPTLKVGCHDIPFFFQLKCLQQFLQPQRSLLEGGMKESHQNNTHNSQAIEQQKLISNSVIENKNRAQILSGITNEYTLPIKRLM